jgi:hypothetical protein
MSSSSFRLGEHASSFDPKSMGNATVSITAYGQGELMSVKGFDNVGLGSVSSTNPSPASVARNAETGLIAKETLKGWADAHYDGIMGLGKTDDSGDGSTALLTAMGIDTFTACFGPLVGDETLGGQLTLSDEPAGLAGQFSDLDPIGRHAWGVELAGWSVHSDHVPDPVCSAAKGHPCAAVVDTGTTLITLPKQSYDSVMTAIEAGCAEVNCLTTLQEQKQCAGKHFDALPDLKVQLGGKELLISPSHYMAEMAVELPAYAKLGPFIFETYTEGERCIPLLGAFPEDPTSSLGSKVQWEKNGKNVTGKEAIFGQPFFRAYAVKFDRPTFGIAVAPIPKGSKMCSGCQATDAASPKEKHQQQAFKALYGDVVKANALQPLDNGDAGAEEAPRVAKLALKDVHMPWYALHPALRSSTHSNKPVVHAKELTQAVADDWYKQL